MQPGDAEAGDTETIWCQAQAFNATKSFENHAIIAFLESIGAEFGACSNAYTSADETVSWQCQRGAACPRLEPDAATILTTGCLGNL